MIKKLFALLLTIIVVLSLSGCGSCSCNEPDEQPIGEKPETFTLMIYMCGSTLESKNGSASNNIKELLNADVPEGVNIVIQTGGSTKWHIPEISSSSTDRYAVENGELMLKDRISAVKNFGEPETLSAFTEWAAEQYPADKYGLILWNHGGGSIKGICFDSNYANDSLTLDELEIAFADATLTIGDKFEFIGYDACLMSTIEVAAITERYSRNMIASQELEPTGGWNYKTIAENLLSENFYNEVLGAYAEKSSDKTYYTLSHIDFSGFDKILDNIELLVDKMSSDSEPRTVVNALNSGGVYGTCLDKDSSYNLYDLGNLFASYGISGELDGVTSVAGELNSNASGLSVYFPLKGSDEVETYYELTPLKSYIEYLQSFCENRNNENVFISKYLTENAGVYNVGVSSESVKNIQFLTYTLYRESDGRTYELGNNLVECNVRASMEFTLSNKWFTFGGEEVLGELMAITGDYSLYVVPATIDLYFADMWFAYNFDTNKSTILGVSYYGDDTGIYELELGAEVQLVHREIVDGKAKDQASENIIIYDGLQEFELQPLKSGNYSINVAVYDVYGNVYDAGTVKVAI